MHLRFVEVLNRRKNSTWLLWTSIFTSRPEEDENEC